MAIVPPELVDVVESIDETRKRLAKLNDLNQSIQSVTISHLIIALGNENFKMAQLCDEVIYKRLPNDSN